MRKIPEFILKLNLKEDKVSSEDKFYLSIIHQYPETPTNSHMAKTIGCGQTKQSAHWHISKLESLGLIINNHRKGRFRKISLNIPDEKSVKGLIVDEIIMNMIESCSLRLVAAVEIGFPIAKTDWLCHKIGMSKRSYIYNRQLLEDQNLIKNVKEIVEEKKLKKTKFSREKVKVFEKKFHGETSSKDKQLEDNRVLKLAGVKNIGLERLSKDNLGRVFWKDQSGKSVNNLENESRNLVLETEEYDMTQSEIIALKNSKISRPISKKKKSPIVKSKKTTLVKPSAEMGFIFKTYPNLTVHKVGSAAHKNTEKTIRGLKNGLVTEFGEYQNELIRKGKNQKLKRSEVLVALNTKFSLKERKHIYQKLNDLNNPDVFPKNKKQLPKNLYDALSHTNKFSDVSWLLYIILREPACLKRTAVKAIDWETEQIIIRWPKFGASHEIKELKKVCSELNKWYYNIFLVPYYDVESVIGGKWGSWEDFFTGFLNFLDKKYPLMDKNPGWFRPTSKPVLSWVHEMKRVGDEIEKQCSVAPWVQNQIGSYMIAMENEERELAW